MIVWIRFRSSLDSGFWRWNWDWIQTRTAGSERVLFLFLTVTVTALSQRVGRRLSWRRNRFQNLERFSHPDPFRSSSRTSSSSGTRSGDLESSEPMLWADEEVLSCSISFRTSRRKPQSAGFLVAATWLVGPRRSSEFEWRSTSFQEVCWETMAAAWGPPDESSFSISDQNRLSGVGGGSMTHAGGTTNGPWVEVELSLRAARAQAESPIRTSGTKTGNHGGGLLLWRLLSDRWTDTSGGPLFVWDLKAKSRPQTTQVLVLVPVTALCAGSSHFCGLFLSPVPPRTPRGDGSATGGRRPSVASSTRCRAESTDSWEMEQNQSKESLVGPHTVLHLGLVGTKAQLSFFWGSGSDVNRVEVRIWHGQVLVLVRVLPAWRNSGTNWTSIELISTNQLSEHRDLL